MRALKIIILLGLLFVGYGYYSISSTTVRMQDFSVQKGDTIASLRTKLVIDINPLLYKIAMKLYANDVVLQSGEYRVTHDVSLREFLSNTIRKPESKDITIKILPGWNMFDIDAYLTGSGIIRSGTLVAIAEHIPDNLHKDYPFLSEIPSLEGFLLPETYRISPSSTPEDIIRILL